MPYLYIDYKNSLMVYDTKSNNLYYASCDDQIMNGLGSRNLYTLTWKCSRKKFAKGSLVSEVCN